MPDAALARLAEYGPLALIVGVCFLAIAGLFWHIVKTHERDRAEAREIAKQLRDDSAAERQRCMERDEKSLRYMRRMTKHQGTLAEAISRLADDDSKKKTWSPRA